MRSRNSTRQVLEKLARFESRNVTFIDPDGSWPIVWQRASGTRVWDAEGRQYLDLTAAFGVAAAGHANPRVVQAGQRQMARLLHAMGDVHPHALKAELVQELSRLTFERWSAPRTVLERGTGNAKAAAGLHAKTILGNSGFEAVEAALKTAMLATGRRGVIAFHGAYHGLGYGALNVTARDHFRSGFLRQLGSFGQFLPFPVESQDSGLETLEKSLRRLLKSGRFGAVLTEPIQARGGINVPPPEFLPMLRRVCSETGALLILDEIYTGFGRTGKWFACEHTEVIPDLICLGKALTGGFPLSACVGRAEVMDRAWPASTGEAIHTSTYLGHPVGCAMALAQIREIESRRLPERSARLGGLLLEKLRKLKLPAGLAANVRGAGLMVGIELRRKNAKPATEECLNWVKGMLREGFVVLPEGEESNVLSLTPPLTITKRELEKAVSGLQRLLAASR